MPEFRETWAGPLEPVTLPPGTLQDVTLSLSFEAGGDPEQEVTAALKPLLGRASIVHYALVRRGLAWNKSRWKILGNLKQNRLTLKSKSLKRSQVESLVDACTALAGAHDLHIRAAIPIA